MAMLVHLSHVASHFCFLLIWSHACLLEFFAFEVGARVVGVVVCLRHLESFAKGFGARLKPHLITILGSRLHELKI